MVARGADRAAIKPLVGRASMSSLARRANQRLVRPPGGGRLVAGAQGFASLTPGYRRWPYRAGLV